MELVGILFGLLFIYFEPCFAQDKAVQEFFVVGKSLELRPPSGIPKDITGVQWRHNGNIAAEWYNPETEVTSYGEFKPRVDLNIVTGVLVIRDMTAALAGDYTIEINNKRLEEKYQVRSLKEVPKPKVWPRPGKDELSRVLICDGDVTGAEPVTYLWDVFGNGTWAEFGQKIEIRNNETTRGIEKFACKIKNPVSEKESDREPNPFHSETGDKSALGALAIIPIVGIIIILGVVAYFKRGEIMKCVSSGEARAAGNGNKVDNKKEEEHALNSKENQPDAANNVTVGEQ